MIRVAIGSLGTIGLQVAKRLDEGIDGLQLTAVSANDRQRAAQKVASFSKPPEVCGLAELADKADIVVECAPAAVFRELAEPVISRGGKLMPLSVGALLSHWDLVESAAQSGAKILVPSGALLGLDAVRAAREGEFNSVTMVTRKPPAGLAGAPHLVNNNISIDNLVEPKLVFEGTAREGAKGFPANVNVAAALSLAGPGPDNTQLQIWADPTVERNTHKIKVDANSASFEMQMYSIPTAEKPATGRIVALSVIASLRAQVSPLVIGA
ncbi:MAG: aspartate dehydrogenase [Pseudomonadota bacterium]